MDRSSKKKRPPPRRQSTTPQNANPNSGRSAAATTTAGRTGCNSKDDVSQRSLKSGKSPIPISSRGVGSGSGKGNINQNVNSGSRKKQQHHYQGESHDGKSPKHHHHHHGEHQKDHHQQHKEVKKHGGDSGDRGKKKKSTRKHHGSKRNRNNPVPEKKKTLSSSDEEGSKKPKVGSGEDVRKKNGKKIGVGSGEEIRKKDGERKKLNVGSGEEIRRGGNERMPEPKRESSVKEVNATKFGANFIERDKEKSRDENELSDVESDKPVVEKDNKVIVKNGSRLSLGDKTFEIIDGEVRGDYGACVIKDILTPEELLMLRYETMTTKCKRIKTECTVLVLAAAAQRTHILRLLLRGSIDNFQLKYVITDALGLHIPDLLKQLSTPHFTILTALRLSYETIECIEDIHKIGFIHRDIKPMSFAFGLKPYQSKLFVTNLGLAKKYRADMKVIPPRKLVPFMGTVKYASRTVHERGERSRKDDLESWIFMIIEFINEKVLQWRKFTKKEDIYHEKCSFLSEEGFADIVIKYDKIPEEFKALKHYCTSLQYDSTPDYNYIKKIIKDTADKKKLSFEDTWEWLQEAPKRKKGSNENATNKKEVVSNKYNPSKISRKESGLPPKETKDCNHDDKPLLPVQEDAPEYTCQATQNQANEEDKKD